MIKSIRYICAAGNDPRQNLAMEEYLLQTVVEGECVLYLWQNRNTVVIGRNQNCWKECKVTELEADGGFLVRRLSGGGAVYHDLGNLNFTFLAHEKNYDLDKQLEVILRAVQKLGIAAEKTGRNDIAAGGRKFSGNAFYASGPRKYHHGTILVEADMEDLSRYLNVSAEKLRLRGIDSVKSRVINLKELNPQVTVAAVRERLLEAFGEVYGLIPREIAETELDAGRVTELTRRFSAWDWTYGRPIPFDYEICKQFVWGDIQLQFSVNRGKVVEAAVYSDALDAALIERIAKAFIGCPFSAAALPMAVAGLVVEDDAAKAIAEDVRALLYGEFF